MRLEVDDAIVEAIREAVIAGACWRAAALSPKTADIWEGLAEDHSRRAATQLERFADGLRVWCARPDPK